MKQIIFYIIIILLLAACSNESGPGPKRPPQTKFTFEVSAPASPDASTRADAENDEFIGDLDVVFFRYDRGTNTEYYDSYESLEKDAIKQMTPGIDGQVCQFEIEIPSDILSTGVRVMVFANCHEKLKEFIDTKVNEQSTRADFHNNFVLDYDWQNSYITPIPMCGIYASYIIDDGENEIPLIRIGLLRMFARIDIRFHPDVLNYFTPIRIYVAGYHSQGMVMRSSDDKLTQEYPTKPNIPNKPVRIVDDRHYYNWNDGKRTLLMDKTIYVPESRELVAGGRYDLTTINKDGVSNPIMGYLGNDQFNGVFLIIYGEYFREPEWEDEYYYRVDFTEDFKTFLPLIRNNKYEIHITKIMDPGHKTLREAQIVQPIMVSNRAISDSFEYEINIY